MKKLKVCIFPVLVTVAVIAAWISVPAGIITDKKKFDEYIAAAEEYEEKKIYVDALDYYLRAAEKRPDDFRTALKAADMYYLLGDYVSFVSQAKKCIAIKKSPAVYSRLLEYYISVGEYGEGLRVYYEAKAANADDPAVRDAGRRLEHSYYRIWLSCSEVGSWSDCGKICQAPAAIDGKWGLISSEGKKLLKFVYDDIGVPGSDGELIPVKKDDEWFYVDFEGNRRLASSASYDLLGPFNDGYAPCLRDGIYGYIDKSFNEKYMEFDFAGPFAHGCAAVEKDGKWGLLSSAFISVTPFEYDLILTDGNGYATACGVAVAVKDGKYCFVGTDGRESAFCFDEAALPASADGMIAVKEGELWFFADRKSGRLSGPGFEGALSFSNGMAPVCVGGDWIYIDEAMEPVSTDVFAGCFAFSSAGSAFVYSGYSYNLIRLSTSY